VQLADDLGQAHVLLAAHHKVAAEVAEAEGVGAVVEAALLAVEDGEAACSGHRWRRRIRDWVTPSAWARRQDARVS
jgi:hypothetical protein